MFSLCPSSSSVMTVSPLLQDPYETRWVRVGQSTVPGERRECFICKGRVQKFLLNRLVE